MADVTVRQLAEVVGAPVDRLLKQMHEAGLSQTGVDDLVSDEEKQKQQAAAAAEAAAAGEAPPTAASRGADDAVDGGVADGGVAEGAAGA